MPVRGTMVCSDVCNSWCYCISFTQSPKPFLLQLRVTKGRARKADLIQVKALFFSVSCFQFFILFIWIFCFQKVLNIFLKEMRLESPVTKEEADEVKYSVLVINIVITFVINIIISFVINILIIDTLFISFDIIVTIGNLDQVALRLREASKAAREVFQLIISTMIGFKKREGFQLIISTMIGFKKREGFQ